MSYFILQLKICIKDLQFSTKVDTKYLGLNNIPVLTVNLFNDEHPLFTHVYLCSDHRGSTQCSIGVVYEIIRAITFHLFFTILNPILRFPFSIPIRLVNIVFSDIQEVIADIFVTYLDAMYIRETEITNKYIDIVTF